VKYEFSERQTAIIRKLADGKSSKEIAREFDMEYRTVESHIRRAMDGTGIRRATGLVACGFREGWLQ